MGKNRLSVFAQVKSGLIRNWSSWKIALFQAGHFVYQTWGFSSKQILGMQPIHADTKMKIKQQEVSHDGTSNNNDDCEPQDWLYTH